MADSVYISGVSCLSSCGLTTVDLLNAMQGLPQWPGTIQVGRGKHDVSYGALCDFSKPLARFVKPLKRRKLSRLSRLAVTAAGLALEDAGLAKPDPDCGVVLGTAFGSTSQSELFYLDMLKVGAVKGNPGLFPETVPNSPAGQVSLAFGMRGPSTTICQQSLSSELGLMTAFDLIADGKAQQVMVIGVEEMSGGLLSGLWSCGGLQDAGCGVSRPLRKRMVVGEAVVAMLLESSAALARRKKAALAKLISVHAAGSARWPAAYTDIARSVQRVATLTKVNGVDCVIPSGSFIQDVDQQHLNTLLQFLAKETPMLVPEYHTGALFGAGLIKQALGVALLNLDNFMARGVGSWVDMHYDSLYQERFSKISNVYTSAITAGGGCAGTVLQRIS